MGTPSRRFDRVKRQVFGLLSGERPKLGDMLVSRGYVTGEQLRECLGEQKRLKGEGQELKLGQLLLKRGYLSTARFLEVLALQEAPAEPAPAGPAGPGAAPREAPAEIGRIGKYILRREIARGGMGVVYEAEDPELKRKVALKVLREGEVGPQVTTRLHREAAIAAQLQHQNIVGIHEVGTARDPMRRLVHFIAMEFIEGRTLADVITESKTPRAELLRMMEEITRAVAYAHERGVIHRDLKPANVLVDPSGRVVLTDFGLARADTFRTQLTRSQAVMGTPQYMAPEQVEGRTRDIDPRTDVYALGVILYEVLTGVPPFVGQTPAQLYQRILQEEPRRPGTVRRQVSSDLEVVCLKALEKERGRRYQSALELAEDLGRFRRGEPILARPPSAFYLFRRKLARRKGVVAVAGLAVVLAVLLAFLAAGGPPGDARSYHELQRELKGPEADIYEARAFFYADTDVGPELERIRRAVRGIEAIVKQPRFAAFPEGWLALGKGRYYVGDVDGAEQAFQEVLQRGANHPTAHFYLGRICLERSMEALIWPRARAPEHRRELSRQLAKRAIGHLEVASEKGGDLEAIDRLAAQGYLAMARGDPDAVLRIAAEGLRAYAEQTGSEEFYNLRGFAKEDLREKIAEYDQAIRFRRHYAWGLFMRGTHRGMLGETAGATEDLDRAIRLRPGFRNALINRGNLRLTQQNFAGALEDFEEALRLGADDPGVFTGRALAYLELGKFDLAEADLKRSLEMDPEDPATYGNRAALHLKRNDPRRAVDDCTRALKLDPSLLEVKVTRGFAWLQLLEPARALSDFTEVILVRPKWAQAYLGRGTAWYRLKELEPAIIDYTEAIRLQPDLLDAYRNRGVARRDRGDWEGVAADFGKVIELTPKDPEPYVERGTAYAQLARYPEALKDYDRALDLGGPNWEHAPAVRKNRAEAVRRMKLR